jgi:hypothetical protein
MARRKKKPVDQEKEKKKNNDNSALDNTLTSTVSKDLTARYNIEGYSLHPGDQPYGTIIASEDYARFVYLQSDWYHGRRMGIDATVYFNQKLANQYHFNPKYCTIDPVSRKIVQRPDVAVSVSAAAADYRQKNNNNVTTANSNSFSTNFCTGCNELVHYLESFECIFCKECLCGECIKDIRLICPCYIKRVYFAQVLLKRLMIKVAAAKQMRDELKKTSAAAVAANGDDDSDTSAATIESEEGELLDVDLNADSSAASADIILNDAVTKTDESMEIEDQKERIRILAFAKGVGHVKRARPYSH